MFENDPKTHQERYRVFIEDVADGFFETDLKGRFIFFNDALCRIFDRPRTQIQDQSYRRFMAADKAEIAFRDFNQIFKSHKPKSGIKWEIIDSSGASRLVEVTANLIFDRHGRRQGFRGIVRDITDQQQALQALEESEQCVVQMLAASHQAERRYKALLDFFPDPVFVLDTDSRVTYVNPAFVTTFGWSLERLKGRHIPFVPKDRWEETRQGTRRLFREKVVHGYDTQRLTKDGRCLDVVLEAALYYQDSDQEPAGQVITLRDVTAEKRLQKINQTLFQISKSLHQFRMLEDRLTFIANRVRQLLDVEGAFVILLDEQRQEFYFRTTAFDAQQATQKWREVRFPADKGVAGEVLRTGRPLVVPDTSKSDFFFEQVDQQVGFHTRSMLDVPLQTQEKTIGVLCAVNKKYGRFDDTDVDLLSTVAAIVALPLENARINEALDRSYDEVQSLNRAKDRVIHHLSHELKTPISVLSASLGLISKKLTSLQHQDRGAERLLNRAQRNLGRLLDMQYEIEDILRVRDFRVHRMLTTLLALCTDELEILIAENYDQEHLIERIRNRIDEEFGSAEVPPREVHLDRFLRYTLNQLQPALEKRGCRLKLNIHPTATIWIPPQVLTKVLTGLIRNAVENTPDGSRIEVSARSGRKGPVFEVTDFGTGITPENQALIFESYFSSADPLQYASRRPFDFNAGGKGFDLLRMKIFSERHCFDIRLASNRCRFIPTDVDLCPGDVANCPHCDSAADCLTSGGTTVMVQFPAATAAKTSERCPLTAAASTSWNRQ